MDFKLHSKEDRNIKEPIKFPPLPELEMEIEAGRTKAYIQNLDQMRKSPEYRYLVKHVIEIEKILRKSPIPPDKDGKSIWRWYTRYTRDAQRTCPAKKTPLVAVCSYKLDKRLRMVYEVYAVNNKLKVLMTDCNFHVYRNRLYSETEELDQYRNILIKI